MKKILLSLGLIGSSFLGKTQEVVFNEIYPDPNSPNTEYIELYNNTGNPVNLDCYTILIYHKENGGGAWLIDLPDIDIAPFGHVVFGSAIAIQAKGCVSYSGANAYDWDLLAVNFGSLTHYNRVGNALVIDPGEPTTDVIPISNGNSAAVAVMLWKGTGVLSNALFTNSDIPQGSSDVVSLSPLLAPLVENEGDGDDCGASATFTFSTISAPAVEVAAITQAPGTNNGYFRTRDGFCGQWDKSQNCPGGSNPLGEFTPGQPNSNLPPINTSTAVLVTIQELGCGGGPGGTTTLWNVGVTISDAGLLPTSVRIYSDNDYTQTLTIPDGAQVGGGQVTLLNTQTNFTNNPIKKGAPIIIQVITAAGCIQITKVFTTLCTPLPVNFKSFTAVRNHSNVSIKWETASEQNNSGFAVERNLNGTWEQVAFVPSQAANGNSSSDLSYQFNDLNNSKGITQYRIKQVDFDAKSKYSEIRSVRGDGQKGKTIIYPNPSTDGKVNVVFEESNVIRDISLMDMAGRTVKQMKGVTNNNITIENLTPGMYTLRVLVPATGDQTVEKIIVNKR